MFATRNTVMCITLFLLGAAVTSVTATDFPGDSLIRRGHIQYSIDQPDSARVLFVRAAKESSTAAVATLWLARLQMERDSIDAAKRLFARAEEMNPNKGYKQFGEGLLLARRNKTTRAMIALSKAIGKDTGFIEALLARGKAEARNPAASLFFAGQTLRRVTELDPDHPSAWFELARYHELRFEFDKAILYYRQQLVINPIHPASMMRMSYVMLELERWADARDVLFLAVKRTRGLDAEIGLAIAASYMGERQFEMARVSYIQTAGVLSVSERGCYEDVTDVATPGELLALRDLTGDTRRDFLRRFWVQRDPTPASALNERLLEHMRRVWYARRYFADGGDPYDNRGRIYVRYGPPDHRSTSTKPNMRRSSRVEMIRERKLRAIYGTRIPDVVREGSIPTFPLSDPEHLRGDVDYSISARNPAADMMAMAGMQVGTTMETSSLMPTHMYRKAWEEWTYTNIGIGLVVTFDDKRANGVFTYAVPPVTQNSAIIDQLRTEAPIEQVARARDAVPEQYFYDKTKSPLDFYYYLAQFRSSAGSTRVDIYYGLPMSELTFWQDTEKEFRASVEQGLAVFDTAWNVKGRMNLPSLLHMKEEPDISAGTLHISRCTVFLEGKQSIMLSLQAKDVKSGRVQSYQEKIRVASYDSTHLALSDIIMGSVSTSRKATGVVLRNGKTVIPVVSRTILRGQDLSVYFEIYNLLKDRIYGFTEYEIEHALQFEKNAKGRSVFSRIADYFSSTGSEVGVSRIIKGVHRSEDHWFTLDSSNLRRGIHILTITVTDLKTRKKVVKKQRIMVV
jgi:GWxTD domain-containing protein